MRQLYIGAARMVSKSEHDIRRLFDLSLGSDRELDVAKNFAKKLTPSLLLTNR